MRKSSLALAVAALVAMGFSGSASAAEVTDNLDIEVAVANSCSMNVQDFSDEISGGSSEVSRAAAGVVTVICNFDTAYQISMDPNGLHYGLGAHVGADKRALADGEGEFLAYNIFQDNDLVLPWGEDTFAKSGVGTGSFEQIFYGLTFYAPNKVSKGVYTDTVPVTLEYLE